MSPNENRSALVEFVEQAAPSPWIDGLDTREKAAGLCKRAALWTVASLDAIGTENELVCLARESFGFHYVVKVDEEILDLTARQFFPPTDLPRICSFDAICAEWPLEPEIVNLESGMTRRFHDIPDNWREIVSVDPPGSIIGWSYGSEWPSATLNEEELKKWKAGYDL